MKIVSTNVYVGPNVWASFPLIRHVIDLGVLEDWPSVKLGTGFRTRSANVEMTVTADPTHHRRYIKHSKSNISTTFS